jgi:hypothetical protein
MVAVVLLFPGVVTSNVTKTTGDFKGSAADEIRRQLEAPAPSDPGEPSKPDESKGDAKSEIEKMLNQQQ